MAVKAIMRKDLERALTVAKIPTWEEKAVVATAGGRVGLLLTSQDSAGGTFGNNASTRGGDGTVVIRYWAYEE
jgi:hypothetical protein